MSFAKNLKQARDEKKLTQEQAAELLNVSRQTISKWELGEGYPKVDKLLLLAKELNISLDYLFAEELAKNNIEDTKRKIPPGMIAVLETFSSAVDNLVEQTFTKGGPTNG